jgi:molecular chaperone GrpE
MVSGCSKFAQTDFMPHDPQNLSTEAATDPQTAPETEAPDLAAELEMARAEAQKHQDAWLRALADAENVRRRAQEDVQKANKFAVERLVMELLGVKDSLEAALASEASDPASLKSGVELTLRQLVSAFEKARVTEINPQGEPFDPHRHQAIGMVESDIPANTVVGVLQKGYLLHDRVVRPAMVTVARTTN